MSDTEKTKAGAIYGAIAAVSREVGAIQKSRRNQQQGFNFRGIDDVYNAFHSVLAKHGVFSTSEILDVLEDTRQTRNGGNMYHVRMRIAWTFHASDGSSVTTVTRGEALDSADKASNKAMATAHKYAFFQMFTVPLDPGSVDDPDAESPEDTAPKQRDSAPGKAVDDADRIAKGRETVKALLADNFDVLEPGYLSEQTDRADGATTLPEITSIYQDVKAAVEAGAKQRQGATA